MENTSIFSKIINGELPAYKIFEDDKTLAILDINPLADGHVLILPKIQVGQIWDLPDDYYTAIWNTSRKVAKQMQKVLKPICVGTVIEGLGVPDHGHVHLVPVYDHEVLRLHHGYPVNTEKENMQKLAKKLSFTD